MAPIVAVCVVVAASGLLMAGFAPGALRQMKEGDTEWRQRWRSLDRSRRQRVVRALRRGEPVSRPEDVELALRGSAQIDHVFRAMRPFELIPLPVIAAVLAFAFADRVTYLLWFFAAVLPLWAVLAVWSLRQQRQRHRSVDATRRLHGL